MYLVAQSVAGGVAGWRIFGLWQGVALGVANLGIALFSGEGARDHWEKQGYEADLKRLKSGERPLRCGHGLVVITSIVQLGLGLATGLSATSTGQGAVEQLRKVASEGWMGRFYALRRACVEAPIFEEFLFRSVVQERLGDIQIWMTEKNPQEPGQRRLRMGLTSCLFGLVHWNKGAGLANLRIIAVTGTLSYFLMGKAKEEDSDVLRPVAYHALLNFAALSGLLLGDSLSPSSPMP